MQWALCLIVSIVGGAKVSKFYRGVFKIQSKIDGGTLLQKYLTAKNG